MQAFNKGLFDFLIATDDPSKQGTGDKTGPSATDATAAPAPSVSQLPEAAGEAAREAAGTSGADKDEEGVAPDHAWTEAAATAKSAEVRHRQGSERLTSAVQKHCYTVVRLSSFCWACVSSAGQR